MVDTDLQIKGGIGGGGGGFGHLDPEIRRAGAGFRETFFLSFGPHFGLKIRETGPSPRFASALYCTVHNAYRLSLRLNINSVGLSGLAYLNVVLKCLKIFITVYKETNIAFAKT